MRLLCASGGAIDAYAFVPLILLEIPRDGQGMLFHYPGINVYSSLCDVRIFDDVANIWLFWISEFQQNMFHFQPGTTGHSLTALYVPSGNRDDQAEHYYRKKSLIPHFSLYFRRVYSRQATTDVSFERLQPLTPGCASELC